jgi:hypothetical protein
VAIAWVLAQRARGELVPIVGRAAVSRSSKNLGALDLELTADELHCLDAVSRIELGFPHDFGGGRLAYGETLPLIADVRRPRLTLVERDAHARVVESANARPAPA